MEFITQFINDLGNFIFIPLIFLVFMVALGRPLAEAIQSAMKVGIGFIALLGLAMMCANVTCFPGTYS